MSAKRYLQKMRESSGPCRARPRPSRQPHRELGEVIDFAVDRDGAAVLLGYDLVADRQSEPGALAGRLGREERLEQFLLVFLRNPDAIVTNADLDSVGKVAGGDLQ